jgi:hypothetical protein
MRADELSSAEGVHRGCEHGRAPEKCLYPASVGPRRVSRISWDNLREWRGLRCCHRLLQRLSALVEPDDKRG